MKLIIGAGLAGLSCSYHLGHKNWTILEQNAKAFGHASSERSGGFIWDQGPHVSFTKNSYVREIFERSVSGNFEEFEVCVSNYFKGNWIDHPAQVSLFQIPEPLRSECLSSFLKARQATNRKTANDYDQWLEAAFGETFAKNFPAVYTRKYWTVDAKQLTTDWVGDRVLSPDIETVIAGALGPHLKPLHYINRVRYPKEGGFETFGKGMADGANICFGAKVARIDLRQRKIWLANGKSICYESLISTIPIPDFVAKCTDVPVEVREAADALSCTQLLLVNIGLPCTTQRPEHWIYVYDEDKLTTRVSFTDKLAPNNSPGPGWTGVQVEVYFSKHRPLELSTKEVGERVLNELIEMGVLPMESRNLVDSQKGFVKTEFVPWANIIYLHDTLGALEKIWEWLGQFGLNREDGDTDPITNWLKVEKSGLTKIGSLAMAGRFAQWKYFWSDDCVLRGQYLAQSFAAYP